MDEKEINKLIKSKLQAIEENLLLSIELTEIKEKIEHFLDQNQGQKVHLILGETEEIRVDKKDQDPNKVFRKVESVLIKSDGSVVKSTLEFFKEKVD